MLPLKEYPFDLHPMICAHRGDTSHGARENTADAVGAALKSGADMIEIDVQMTSDGVLVCHHDETIGAVDGGVIIWKETYNTLTAKLDGNVPATFEEVLELAKGKAYLNIEMKEYSNRMPESYIGPLVYLVRKAGMHEFSLYSSFRIDYLRSMPWDAATAVIHPTSDIVEFFNARSQNPVMLPKKAEDMLPSELMRESHATTYACMLDELTETHIADIRSRNIHLSVYTIRDEDEFRRAISLGARAVVTDIPHELVVLRNKLYTG